MNTFKRLWFFLFLFMLTVSVVIIARRQVVKLVEHPEMGMDSLIPYPIQIRNTLPEFTLLDIEGNPQATKQWHGKILVLNFWATWCPPCRQEIPQFVALQNELGSKGLQFVGVAIDDPVEVRRFAAANNVNYPNLIGDARALQISAQLGNRIQGLPFSVIFDRSGSVIHRSTGELTEAEVRSKITPLL